ncbi:hypothetical protein C7974DRAFT_475294 [Boeremia exigua]|uniref:uncharacterized protein n=1 Tax=Boeremia exigua TaxID=749465 RepID=UPI001E8CA96B|nr:uncharacterized protein C7974DRAFT_475294 [Boeremia exigua]KAH6614844.1 hypothetical protein C7974DRAFT_475294 [Boeremia exigua]
MAVPDRHCPSAEATFYLVNHVALPPQLPQADDFHAGHERCLLKTTLIALQALKPLVTAEHSITLKHAIETIKNLQQSQDRFGNTSEAELVKLFDQLAHGKNEGSIPLEIKAQNAGILISSDGNDITFEFFELSPNNKSSMSKGRLVRTFPGFAASIPTAKLQERSLQDVLAGTLAKMSTQAAPGFQPVARKAGQDHDEDRDTTHPGMVTDYLLNIVAALGKTITVTRITKHTREETLWDHCKQPWRRSPMWLLIRVTLQLLFSRQGPTPFTGLYKVFVVQLLSSALEYSQKHWHLSGSGPLHALNAKMLRRLRKLEALSQLHCVIPSWIDRMQTCMTDAFKCMDRNWKAEVQASGANLTTSSLKSLRPENALDMALPELELFLAAIKARKTATVDCKFEPGPAFPMFAAGRVPQNFTATGDHWFFRLAAAESWVENHLQPWIESYRNDEKACRQLYYLMTTYYKSASHAYKGLPCSISLMYLTILEIWVACDKSACSLFPLLTTYDPEVRLIEFQCLSLPLRSQMQRLQTVEAYVQARKRSATNKTSLYRGFGVDSSFGVQYFSQCSQLQSILQKIEQKASEKRQEKCEELARLKARYKTLMDQYSKDECDYVQIVKNRHHGYMRTVHSRNCNRCALKRTADDLGIGIHEWPLSPNASVAQATIFESKIPNPYSAWRDASVFVITDVLGCKSNHIDKPKHSYTLNDHPDLNHLLDPESRSRRIMPLSEVKPHSVTHRKIKKAVQHLQDVDVCLENGLRYKYCDTVTGAWTAAQTPSGELQLACTHRLPHRSKALERFLQKPPSAPDGVQPNEVIASLSDCPPHLSLEEYKAFGTLSQGRNIFYSNILTQLAAPTLDFSKVETQCMVLQTVTQAGLPNETVERINHHILNDTIFGLAMLERLNIATQRVEENWESWRAVATFIQLACRITNLTTSSEVRQRSLQFLHRARCISIIWLRRLKARAASSTNDEQRTELFSRATEIALLGTTTFDVENEFVDVVLQQQDALSSLLQFSIAVKENQDLVPGVECLQESAMQAWRALMYRIFPKLRDAISRDCTGVNEAVSRCWAAFQPATLASWSIYDEVHQHWLCTVSGTLPVHINLLTGELLVNGLPLTRLPSEYLAHPMYKPLFSASALEVVPTDEPGMRFSAKSTYHDNKIHFGMVATDMLVLAMSAEKKFDLIPPRLFTNRMPVAFVTSYVHWYDHETGHIVFRPRHSPWQLSNVQQWCLQRHGSSWRLGKSAQTLINMKSKDARMISMLFKSLEDEQFIHISHDTVSHSVKIEVPRLKLDFHINEGENQIHSRQYRGLILDQDQRIGTLVGLTSKLVLRRATAVNDRLVLIPEGTLSYRKNLTHHVSVSISRQEDTPIHAYQIDATLGRVMDSGAVQSKLLLCLLHALTSHCLCDPLTRYTGTESALIILRSSAIRSFSALLLENVELLNKIAALSPSRTFYPPHKRLMQQIEWDPVLPSGSQHSDFRVLVNEILDHEKRMSLFHSHDIFQSLNRGDTAWMTSTNPDLEERANIRASTFRVAGFGAEKFTSSFDTNYEARDRQGKSERGRRAFLAASMLIRDQVLLDQPISQFKVYHDHLRNSDVTGLMTDDSSVLQYDSKWLGSPSPLILGLWCTLHHRLVTKSTIGNKFNVLVWLATMAYAPKADMDVIRAFVAFYRSPQFAWHQIPAKPKYHLSQGSSFQLSDVQDAARHNVKSYEDSSEAQLPKKESETDDQHLNRIESLHRDRKDTAVQTFVANLQGQWPCEHPKTPSSARMNEYLDTDCAMRNVRKSFESWYNNQTFEQYMKKISGILERSPAAPITEPQFGASAPNEKVKLAPDGYYCSLSAIFASTPPNVSKDASNEQGTSLLSVPPRPELPHVPNSSSSADTETEVRLQQFCETLEVCAKTVCEQRYVDALRVSCASLRKHKDDMEVQSIPVDSEAQDTIRRYLSECEEFFNAFDRQLGRVLVTGSTRSNAIASSIQHLPRMTPSLWLTQLNRNHYDLLPTPWPAVIVEFGLSITSLHRAQRLVALLDKPLELNEELQHIGHTNWSPSEQPEFLLLEAESGILIRPVQATIAAQMMHPPGAQNTVMQLNMGEGKSSTIVPTVAAALADRKRLVRVITAKPQSKQMLEMLVAKLGGLLNRRIYHLPFSRDLRLREADARAILEMCQECMACRGVLLVQPEHILSFKLMGIECLLSEKPGVAQLLLDTERWFETKSRDIVDESDENFSVRFELIYTIGSQRSIGFAPDRWLLIQEIMGLIPRIAVHVMTVLPRSVEVQHDTDGKFPRVRILNDEGADAILALLTEHIIKNGLTGLPICNQPRDTQEAILQYISITDLSTKQIQAVELSRFWTAATKEPLLLVRGLIAGGVLRFSLSQKRWRVNYGLDHARIPSTLLAVPYRAKDSPSPRSEFSHPDVVILLTLLSYYYGGLQDEELFDAFHHLLKSDQSTIYYEEWVRTASSKLPTAFRQLSGISIKDRVMCIEQIFPHMRWSRAVVNYYLTFLVFPKAMKEFPSKLSASGWDLGAVKTHPTTGFSGTNDTLHVLPLAVKHLDLPSQSHTNALVLGYLLKQETSVEKLPLRSEGSDAEHLLTVINSLKPEIRVVLDVGAQILEMDNTQVAECWLSMRKNDRTEAVVFFKNEELSVIDINGRIEPFQTSPFAKQLDRCLIYLDEAHTRGTDLKLPRDYRAAVTLGAGLTKDRLVQACMRLRKLGKGQSVVFIASQEVCTKICERTDQKPDEPITVVNVLCWSIGETWLDLSRSMPLWAVQGVRYETHKHLLNGANTKLSQGRKFLEDEAQSIKDRYAPSQINTGHSMLQNLDVPNIKLIHARCLEFQAVGFNSATLQEEQERELSPEIEEERQIERPQRMTAAAHKVHEHVEHLVHTGTLIHGSPAFEPAFQALKSTSAALHSDLSQFPRHLLVTADFIRTVKIPPGSNIADFVSDSYQRPVQWVLSTVDPVRPNEIEHLVILSPFEANELQSTIIKYKKVTLHLYAPCFNASFSRLDDLQLFNVGRNFENGRVPQSLTVQLNLFSGSLYLRDFAEYEAVCDFLGLLRDSASPGQQVYADGFIDPPSGKWGLKTSPVQFLRALLMKIRKEGEGVEKTHMGRLLGGVRLEKCDFGPEVSEPPAGPGAPVSMVVR